MKGLNGSRGVGLEKGSGEEARAVPANLLTPIRSSGLGASMGWSGVMTRGTSSMMGGGEGPPPWQKRGSPAKKWVGRGRRPSPIFSFGAEPKQKLDLARQA